MGEILILTSINGCLLTNKLIDSWFDANEMYIIQKIFSNDRHSVEITFIDEERADMMSDLLTTCYSDSIAITRPQTMSASLNNSSDEERIPSPVHLSSSVSISSKVSSFSQRLVALDKQRNDNKMQSVLGRGRGIDVNPSQNDELIRKNIPDDFDNNSTISSTFGRGRGSLNIK
ncbi:hypothetical protein I4U23_010284 [Adineta vaga]|nr:hypothetical protein I4U23_010284 [Adineta vaga]